MSEIPASIVIPVYNRWDLTRRCLDGLLAARLQAEVIVSDDGSSDETSSALPAMFPQVRYLRADINGGYAVACNRGAREARGKFLVLLNNDTTAEDPRWLERLLQAPGDLVGVRLVYPNGRLQHAGVVFPAHGSPYHLYRGLPRDFRGALRGRKFKAVTAACMRVPTSLFLELGGFDETYRNGCEDVDLCLRAALEHEATCYYEPSVVITHMESQSPGRYAHEDENQRLLAEKRGLCMLQDDKHFWAEDGLSEKLGEKLISFGAEWSPGQGVEAWEGLSDAVADAVQGRLQEFGLIGEPPARRPADQAGMVLCGGRRVPLVGAEAEDILIEVLDHLQKEPQRRYLEVRQSMESGDLRQAEQEARHLLELYPASFWSHMLMGDVLWTEGQWLEAAPHYEFCVQRDIGFSWATCNMASILARQGKHESARDLLTRFLSKKPFHARARWQQLTLGLR